MNLEVFVLGTGGMMPLPKRHLTSVLVRREGDLFLFDCGEGTQVSLRQLNLRWKKISAIFISHTHADHVTGLPGILMLSSQVDRDEPLYIYGPPKIRDYIESSRQVLDMYINYEIIVREMPEGGVAFQGDGFHVRGFPVRHSKPCLGWTLEEADRPGMFYPEKARELGVPVGPMFSRLQNGESVVLADGNKVLPEQVMGDHRPGRKFSFVTDSLAFPEIANEVRNSDLFICEGMFTDDLRESAIEKKHMTSRQAAHIARDARVGRLGLIHYSPRYTERDLTNLVTEAREIFPDSFLTRDRQILPLANHDEVV